jgi:hypothetical protein
MTKVYQNGLTFGGIFCRRLKMNRVFREVFLLAQVNKFVVTKERSFIELSFNWVTVAIIN